MGWWLLIFANDTKKKDLRPKLSHASDAERSRDTQA